MSLDAQDWVWEHSASKGTARLAILAIADKASGPDCSAYAGTTFLVQRSNAARSAVIVAVDKLLASGELEVIKDRKGPRGETCYRLPLAVGHCRKGGPESGPVRNQDPSGIRTPWGPESGPEGSGNETPTGPESGPQNTRNADTRRETHRDKRATAAATHPADADTPERDYHWPKFGGFWVNYPRKKSMGKAKTAWQAALDRGADPDQIISAAADYAHERHGKDPNYTPHPATWLDNEGYLDEPDPDPAPQQNNGPETAPNDLSGLTDEEIQRALQFG